MSCEWSLVIIRMNKISDCSFTNRYDMIEIQEKDMKDLLDERQLYPHAIEVNIGTFI